MDELSDLSDPFTAFIKDNVTEDVNDLIETYGAYKLSLHVARRQLNTVMEILKKKEERLAQLAEQNPNTLPELFEQLTLSSKQEAIDVLDAQVLDAWLQISKEAKDVAKLEAQLESLNEKIRMLLNQQQQQ